MRKQIINKALYAWAKVFSMGLLIAVTSSCKRNNDLLTDQQSIHFTSTIAGQITTKANGISWDQGDKIGVFMVNNGQELSATSIVNNVNNIPFTINGAIFQSAMPVYLPKTSVDFIAFYPHKAVDNFTYPVDLTDQTNQAALDLMYTNDAKGINPGTLSIPLVFNRQLSRLAINLTINNTDALKASQLKATLSEATTKAAFDLRNGTLTSAPEKQAIEASVTVKSDNNALVELTLLPGENISGKKIKFESPSGERFTWTIPTFTALEKGTRYTVNININNGDVTGGTPQTQAYQEIPKMENLTSKMTFLFKQMPQDPSNRNFSMLFDSDLKYAYWVAYPLHRTHIGSVSRTNAWGYDPQISSSFQANLTKSYGGDYDRGHQLPSGDRTANAAANRTTFYYTNMTPQTARLNQGIWANLENQIRTWTTKTECDTMYVVTGAMPYPNINDRTTTDGAGARVPIPKYYFKALAMKTKDNKFYTIAYKMDNEVPPGGASFNTYKTSVKELEATTGFTFFPNLTEAQKNTANNAVWN